MPSALARRDAWNVTTSETARERYLDVFVLEVRGAL